PLFDTLENRQLMSASPFVINGTPGNDVITVNYGTNLVVAQSPFVQNTAAAKLINTPASAAAAGKVTTAVQAGFGVTTTVKPVVTQSVITNPVATTVVTKPIVIVN